MLEDGGLQTTAALINMAPDEVMMEVAAGDGGEVQLAVLLSGDVGRKDLVVTLESGSPDALWRANPTWSVSKQLGAPYQYFPGASRGELVFLTNFHTLNEKLELKISRWKIDRKVSLSDVVSDIFLVRKKFGFQVFERVS